MKQKRFFFLMFMSANFIFYLAGSVFFTSCNGDSDTELIDTIILKEDNSFEGNPFEGKWKRVKSEYYNDIVYYEDKNYYSVFASDGRYSTEGYSKDISEADNCTYSFDSLHLIINHHPDIIDTFKYKFVESDVLELSLYNANHNLGVAFRQSVETFRKVIE